MQVRLNVLHLNFGLFQVWVPFLLLCLNTLSLKVELQLPFNPVLEGIDDSILYFLTNSLLDFIHNEPLPLFLLLQKVKREYVLGNFAVYNHDLSHVHVAKGQEHKHTVYKYPIVHFRMSAVELLGGKSHDVVDAVSKDDAVHKDLNSRQERLLLCPHDSIHIQFTVLLNFPLPKKACRVGKNVFKNQGLQDEN